MADFLLLLTAVDFFVLTLVPLDVGVSALPVLGGPCGFLLDVLVAVDLFGLFGVLRCIVVPVVGSHSRCAGLTRSKETVSTLPFHYSATPRDDLIWSVVRGGQRRRNCDSAQEYMSTCSYFLELENVVLLCVTWRT